MHRAHSYSIVVINFIVALVNGESRIKWTERELLRRMYRRQRGGEAADFLAHYNDHLVHSSFLDLPPAPRWPE